MTPITGWEHYLIDETGNIFSFYKQGCNQIHHVIGKHGYARITLTKNKKPKTLSVHRLVAFTFIPNPNNEPWINHKDGNKQNNNVSNLEWSNRIHNAKHARETGLYRVGVRHQNSKLTDNQAHFIKYIAPKLGFTNKELCHMFGRHKATISHVTNGDSWNHI